MAARPRLLISDEAMAGLSPSEVDEVLAILLQLNGVGARLARVLQHDQERIGGAQLEVRARDIRGDRDAHGLAEVLRGDEIVRSRQRAAAILAPEVELVRRFDAYRVVVACDRRSGRKR